MSHEGGGSVAGSTHAESGASSSDSEKAERETTADADGTGTGKSSGLFMRITVVLVGILLLTAIAGSNVAVAADRTVLDVDHVVETMGERGLFADETDNFRNEVAGKVATGTEGLDLPPGIELVDFDPDAVADDSVSEAHVREQMTENLEQLFAFLHGDRNDLSFVFDLRPVKEGVSESVTESATVRTPVLVGERSDRIDAERIAALEESEESFEEAQMDLSEREVEAIKADIEADVQANDYTPELAEALISLQFTVVDGLAGEISYDEYTEQLAGNERDLEAALGTEAVADMDDSVTLGSEDESASEAFAEMADIVQITSTLAMVLPIVALGLVGAVGAITRDVRRTAKTTGLALLGAGVLGLVVGFALPESVLPAGGEGESDLFGDGFHAAVESMFEVIGIQSIILTLGGVLLVGLVIAEGRGLFDGLKGIVGAEAGDVGGPATQDAAAPDQQPEASADQKSDTKVPSE